MQSAQCNRHDYQRRVLLAVSGTTPQILTETLYALSRKNPPFIPTEVHVITSAEGARRVRLQLLGGGSGKFHRLCADYRLPPIAFAENHVTVLQDRNGQPLEDIVSPEDNECAADQIIAWLRTFTEDADCAIHACLAGGRKTMGFYLGYGLSLHGRRQDCLSHVLVSPEFEGHRDFFYPPPTPQTIFARTLRGSVVDERPISTADARIWLAEIPFVRLRDGLPVGLLKGNDSYTDTVAAVQRSLPDNLLRISMARREIVCGGIPIKLPPRLIAFYTWHARRRFMPGDTKISWKETLGEGNSLMEEYFSVYLSVLNNDALHPDYEEARRAYANGFGKDDWANSIHHINSAILKVLGQYLASHFQIRAVAAANSGRLKRYGLDYPAERIQIE